MNFRLLHQTDQLVYRYQLREQDSHELYGDQLSIYQCEIPRFVKEIDRPLNPIEEWFELLQNMSKFAGRPEGVGKRFDSILESCRQNRLGTEEQEQYFNAMISEHEKQSIAAAYKEEGFREGVEKGIEKGIEQGLDMAQKRIAQSLLAMGMLADDVVKATGLSLKDVEELSSPGEETNR